MVEESLSMGNDSTFSTSLRKSPSTETKTITRSSKAKRSWPVKPICSSRIYHDDQLHCAYRNSWCSKTWPNPQPLYSLRFGQHFSPLEGGHVEEHRSQLGSRTWTLPGQQSIYLTQYQPPSRFTRRWRWHTESPFFYYFVFLPSSVIATVLFSTRPSSNQLVSFLRNWVHCHIE